VTTVESPYAYPEPTKPSKPTGKQLLSASWRMLRQDRELLWLPAMGALFGALAAGILFVPGWFLGRSLGGAAHHSWGAYAGGVLAAFGASVVSIYFQAALVVGANERADGGDPTLRSAMNGAWERRGRILRWAVVTTTVGTAIRAAEERLGILGNILGFLAGVAWAVASFLVVPVLVAEEIGPIEAVKRSAQIIKQTWGTSLRTTVRFGLTQVALMLIPVLVGIVGVVAVASGSTGGIVFGVLLLAAAVVGFLGLAMVFSAIGSYARALIYRYATGKPVPGIDPYLFMGVFQPKKRRRRFA
jgi:hypothetical protein